MPYTTISLDCRPPLAIVTLQHRSRERTIDRTLLTELQAAVEQLCDTDAIRAAILTGTDGVFSGGWDSALLQELRQSDPPERREELLAHSFQFLAEAGLPTVAALNGDALSAGFELALACDLRIAATSARLGLPETASGLIPMGGGTQRLARLAGRAVALQMVLTAEPVDAATALRYGLVSAVVEPENLLSAACTLGTAIAERGPLAVRLAKEAVHRGVEMPLEQALRFETDLTVLLQTTEDRAEGVRAFEEKRRPEFEGR